MFTSPRETVRWGRSSRAHGGWCGGGVGAVTVHLSRVVRGGFTEG